MKCFLCQYLNNHIKKNLKISSEYAHIIPHMQIYSNCDRSILLSPTNKFILGDCYKEYYIDLLQFVVFLRTCLVLYST